MNPKMVAYGGLLTAVQVFLYAVEKWLVVNDLGTPGTIHLIKACAGGVLMLGVPAGGIYWAYRTFQATTVNATLQLVAAGKALDGNGVPIPPPPAGVMPATKITAAQIVRDNHENGGG
jgi:hypothetical protein